MSPSVLAAVDARLRASASNNSLREPSPLLRQGAFPANSVRSGSVSKASSLSPVITHHQVLQSSEAIMSREQLYDMLNKDDDEDEKSRRKDSGDTDATGHYLRTPRPGFAGGGSSTQSLRRNSMASSTVADSEIELVVNSRKQFSSSTLGKGGAPFAAHASSGAGGAKKAPYESGSLHNDEDYSDVPMTTEKSAWLKNKSSATRKYRSLCCVIGLLLFIGCAVGIALGFRARKDKVDGLAPPPYVFFFTLFVDFFSLSFHDGFFSGVSCFSSFYYQIANPTPIRSSLMLSYHRHPAHCSMVFSLIHLSLTYAHLQKP